MSMLADVALIQTDDSKTSPENDIKVHFFK
jgi:hypothetical protein